MMPLKLTPAGLKHARQWYLWRKDESALRYNPMSEVPLDLLQDRLSQSGSDLSNETYHEYRWIIESEGNLIGTVSLHQVSWPHLHADLGYQIDAAYQGQKIGGRAVSMLIEKAFQESRLNRLIALIHSENVASIKIVERLGFQHEGTLRSHFQIGGQFVNEEIFGLLRDEWQDSNHSD